jgi:mannose-6-phosphate isomerase-like protein (cupin superfamily)
MLRSHLYLSSIKPVTLVEDGAIINREDGDQEPFPESGLLHRKLTQRLGCTEPRVNAIPSEPGQPTAPHSHERQEEVYVALNGGHVQIGDSVNDVVSGGVVRVGPDPIRSIRNESSDTPQTWLLFGSPPVGTIEDFDEYTMPDE